MYLLNLSVVEMLVLRKIETLTFKASPHWPSTLIANFESLSPHLHSLLLKGPVLSFPSARKQRFGVSTFRTCYQLEGWFWFPILPSAGSLLLNLFTNNLCVGADGKLSKFCNVLVALINALY